MAGGPETLWVWEVVVTRFVKVGVGALRLAAATSVMLGLTGASALQAQGAAPFAGFAGNWSGGGEIAMTDGSKERIRCRAQYSNPPSGNALHISINCASDSYKVNVISNVVADAGGDLSGTWRETTRQAEGNVSGRVNGGQIQATLDGTVYSISLSVNTRGASQSVSISAQGADVQSVRISMHKG